MQCHDQCSRGLDGARVVPSTWADECCKRQVELIPTPPKWGLHCLVACLFRGGKVITQGLHTCSNGSPNLQPHLLRLAGGRQPLATSCHAEIAALNSLPASVTACKLRQCTLVVVRPSYNSESGQTTLLCAKPCKECATVISRLGIKAVVYSDGDRLIRRTPEQILLEARPSWGTRRLLRYVSEAPR